MRIVLVSKGFSQRCRQQFSQRFRPLHLWHRRGFFVTGAARARNRRSGRHLHLRSVVIFGGVGMEPQKQALKAGIDILIATPGRLLDLANQGRSEERRVGKECCR